LSMAAVDVPTDWRISKVRKAEHFLSTSSSGTLQRTEENEHKLLFIFPLLPLSVEQICQFLALFVDFPPSFALHALHFLPADQLLRRLRVTRPQGGRRGGHHSRPHVLRPHSGQGHQWTRLGRSHDVFGRNFQLCIALPSEGSFPKWRVPLAFSFRALSIQRR